MNVSFVPILGPRGFAYSRSKRRNISIQQLRKIKTKLNKNRQSSQNGHNGLKSTKFINMDEIDHNIQSLQ